ncbi:putative peptidase S10, serine carboxypeptidase, alpha/Beta hydrolase [Helianthus annuus]|nr:putative peptidase S10, serine carboxypeptidase, alpha/Beta hydrolase [Helianthus annuus]
MQGYGIVSPYTDRFIDLNSRLEFAHRVALISDDIYKSTKETCRGNYIYPDPNNTLCLADLQRVDEVRTYHIWITSVKYVIPYITTLILASFQFQCLSDINFSNILEPVCDDINPSPDCPAATKITIDAWANDKEVQKALHIRPGTIGVWEKTNETIHYTFGKNDTICYSYDVLSVVDVHKQLVTRNCQALIISGDHDLTFPYVGVEKWIKSLNVPIKSPWNPWFVDNQVVGYQMTYATTGYSLVYATIKGGGHSVALNKPKEAAVLLDGWIASHTDISDS